MFNRKSVLMVCGAILGLAVAVSASAWVTPNKTDLLTFSGPVGLPGVTLPAGTYVFELAATPTASNVVRVMNRERTMVYFGAFTARIDRLEPVPDHRRVSFGEAPKGVAQPITAWYPGGESMGHRFIYRGGL